MDQALAPDAIELAPIAVKLEQPPIVDQVDYTLAKPTAAYIELAGTDGSQHKLSPNTTPSEIQDYLDPSDIGHQL